MSDELSNSGVGFGGGIQRNIGESKLPQFPIKFLPSNFKTYSNRVFSVEPLSFIQSKNLSNLNSTLSIEKEDLNSKSITEKNIIIDSILKGVSYDGNKEDIFFSDLSYIALYRKVLTYGVSPLNYNWTCPHCNNANKEIINFNSLKINSLEDSDVLPEKVGIVELEPPRIWKIREYMNFAVESDLPEEVLLLALCVKSLSMEHSIELLDSVYLEEEIAEMGTKVGKLLNLGKFKVDVKCKNKECLREAYIGGDYIVDSEVFDK